MRVRLSPIFIKFEKIEIQCYAETKLLVRTIKWLHVPKHKSLQGIIRLPLYGSHFGKNTEHRYVMAMSWQI